ncbi:MAG: hypothetical protein JNM19_00610 [Chitinophagaceae bacterium]|nr:hypothetical protein [Chitinophagaceae bacterium]
MRSALKQISMVLPAALILASCGDSGEKKAGGESAAKTETKAAPAALKPLDLTSNGIPLTIQAPEGATVGKEEGSDAVVVSKDRFNIIITEDKYGDEAATAEQAKETTLAEDNQSLNNPELGMKMEVLKNDPAGYIYMTTNKQGGKIVRFTTFVQKDKKKYIIKENFMALNDIDRSMETGYSISREEIETMYNAVKQ